MSIKHHSLLIVAMVLFFTSCGNSSNTVETKSIEQLHQEEGVPVIIETVSPVTYTSEHSFYAVLTGIEQTDASAIIADKVDGVSFNVGDQVLKDDIVVTFPTDNPATQYYQAKVTYEHAMATVKRIKTLYENGGVSLQEYENTRTQCDVAMANWEAVQQSVAVQAPISGILTNISVRVSDNVAPGDILFTISNMQKLKARLWVSENQIEDVAVGDSATASWRDIILNGTVSQVDLSLDSSKQAFGVVVEFDNSKGHQVSGVDAAIVIRGAHESTTVIVERKNMEQDGDSYFVYLAEHDVAVKREVIPGRSRGISMEIVKGLYAGDRLITEGQLLLKDNTKIRVMNEYDMSYK